MKLHEEEDKEKFVRSELTAPRVGVKLPKETIIKTTIFFLSDHSRGSLSTTECSMSTRVDVEDKGGVRVGFRTAGEPVRRVKAAPTCSSEIEGELEREGAGGAGVGSSRTTEK